MSEIVLAETQPVEYSDLAALPHLKRHRLVEQYGASDFWRITPPGLTLLSSELTGAMRPNH
jgi:hypothetical protein